MLSHFPGSADIVTDEHGTTAVIELDPTLYPEDVAIRAAYWLTDRYHVHLSRSNAGKLVAEVRSKDGRGGTTLSEACGEFCNALIDFALRARVAIETKDVHDALLQRAFTALVPKAGG